MASLFDMMTTGSVRHMETAFDPLLRYQQLGMRSKEEEISALRKEIYDSIADERRYKHQAQLQENRDKMMLDRSEKSAESMEDRQAHRQITALSGVPWDGIETVAQHHEKAIAAQPGMAKAMYQQVVRAEERLKDLESRKSAAAGKLDANSMDASDLSDAAKAGFELAKRSGNLAGILDGSVTAKNFKGNESASIGALIKESGKLKPGIGIGQGQSMLTAAELQDLMMQHESAMREYSEARQAFNRERFRRGVYGTTFDPFDTTGGQRSVPGESFGPPKPSVDADAAAMLEEHTSTPPRDPGAGFSVPSAVKSGLSNVGNFGGNTYDWLEDKRQKLADGTLTDDLGVGLRNLGDRALGLGFSFFQDQSGAEAAHQRIIDRNDQYRSTWRPATPGDVRAPSDADIAAARAERNARMGIAAAPSGGFRPDTMQKLAEFSIDDPTELEIITQMMAEHGKTEDEMNATLDAALRQEPEAVNIMNAAVQKIKEASSGRNAGRVGYSSPGAGGLPRFGPRPPLGPYNWQTGNFGTPTR